MPTQRSDKLRRRYRSVFIGSTFLAIMFTFGWLMTNYQPNPPKGYLPALIGWWLIAIPSGVQFYRHRDT